MGKHEHDDDDVPISAMYLLSVSLGEMISFWFLFYLLNGGRKGKGTLPRAGKKGTDMTYGLQNWSLTLHWRQALYRLRAYL
jgi:hypothetical protein